MPAEATDCHVHIVGPQARFRFDEKRAHRAYDAPKEVLHEIQARLGIARCVVVHGVVHGLNVAVTLDALFTSNGRYRATMPNDPAITDQRLEELNACGFRAVRFDRRASEQGIEMKPRQRTCMRANAQIEVPPAPPVPEAVARTRERCTSAATLLV